MNGNHLNQNQAISIFDPDTLYNAKKKSRKKMIKAVVLLMMAVLLMCFVINIRH